MVEPPIPAAALEHIALLGKTGSGKSYAAQGLVVRRIEKRERVCVIDPTDPYWGLRLLADGKNPSGYEVVSSAARMPTCRPDRRMARRSPRSSACRRRRRSSRPGS